MSKRVFALGLCLLLAVLNGTPTSSLQSARQLFVVEQEWINPALTEQYEEGVRFALAGMRKARLGPEMNWDAAQHHSSYFYIFQVQSLDELDLLSPRMKQRTQQLGKAMDEAAARRFAGLTTPAIRGNHLSVLEPVAEFSYQPASSVVKAPRYNYVDIVRVQAGKVEQFKAVTGRIIEALRKADYPIGFTAFRTVIGDGKVFFDEGRTYYFVAPYDNRSQFYEQHPFSGALEKGLGKQDAERLLAEYLKCLNGHESYDYQRRPDLSYQAGKN